MESWNVGHHRWFLYDVILLNLQESFFVFRLDCEHSPFCSKIGGKNEKKKTTTTTNKQTKQNKTKKLSEHDLFEVSGVHATRGFATRPSNIVSLSLSPRIFEQKTDYSQYIFCSFLNLSGITKFIS